MTETECNNAVKVSGIIFCTARDRIIIVVLRRVPTVDLSGGLGSPGIDQNGLPYYVEYGS